MSTTFIALSSMSGIACASDTDHTIYQLSKKQPLAIAVNSFSPIPWDSIINAYKGKGEPECKMNFEDYALDFMNHLSSVSIKESWKNLSDDDANIILMGYGQKDLFPCLYDILLGYNEDSNHLEMKKHIYTRISHTNQASVNLLGNLESVSTILWGATDDTKHFFLKKHVELFDVYKNRVLEKFKGTEYEEYVSKKLETYDPEASFVDSIIMATNRSYRDVQCGLDSFSIEEMVTAAETIVNAEVRLDHLRSGCNEPLHNTKEIAVITRVEGLTWLKHSLYAL